ncbi:MAG: cobyric acid synthase [Chloroflexi bacterium]|nr:cobyric acid synthase [Chloroflexota bacterium]
MSATVLMVQGTASSVGKSVIVAGLCRLLRRRGLRVAPFKAQNMSLNAAVTLDGGEIGRSTAVQAAAAGIEPTVEMNPILLKPEAGMQSQVIVRGRARGTLHARDYFRHREKQDLWPVVAEALDHLRARYEVVVAEGAGSPAEMNLRDRDIVNMRVARYARAGVILVGDIDRGGVFAQLIGTLDLLPPDERALVQGLIVNRFRGDPALFTDGVRFLEERSGRPVFGVVPMVYDLGLAEEDSTALDDERLRARRASPTASLRIAVVRLLRIANFDDFGPLERLSGVTVDYVDRPDQLEGADLVILPGSKSTIADLEFLRERGLAEAILAARERGTPILGICGGYQILGQEIHDPDRVESPAGSVRGLRLLPHQTVFVQEKQTCRVRARLIGTAGPFAVGAGSEVDGYEIHAGRTIIPEDAAPAVPIRIIARSGHPVDEPAGVVSDDGLVLGTYLHGLFENEVVRQSLLAWLHARRPLSAVPEPGPQSWGKGEAWLHPLSQYWDRLRNGRQGVRAAPYGRGVSSPLPIDPYDRWADTLEATVNIPLLFERCGVAR